MLLADGVHITLLHSGALFVIPIHEGTGIYRRAHAAITASNIGNDTEFTIKVTY